MDFYIIIEWDLIMLGITTTVLTYILHYIVDIEPGSLPFSLVNTVKHDVETTHSNQNNPINPTEVCDIVAHIIVPISVI